MSFNDIAKKDYDSLTPSESKLLETGYSLLDFWADDIYTDTGADKLLDRIDAYIEAKVQHMLDLSKENPLSNVNQLAILKDLKPTDLIVFQSKQMFTAEEAQSLQRFLEAVCQCKVLLLSPNLDVSRVEIDFGTDSES